MFHLVPPERVEKFQEAVRYISESFAESSFAADNLISVGRNLSFLKDTRFCESFWPVQTGDLEKSTAWRLHVVTWAANHCLQVPGDFVACGIHTGFQELVTCRYLDFGGVAKTFYFYDSFSGLPTEGATADERRMYAHYGTADRDHVLHQVQSRFGGYSNVRVIQAFVPDVFAEQSPEQIAYLHIDLGVAQAEIATLETLFERVSPGGIIILELFGRQEHQELMRAATEFASARGHQILELPTGQGMILKH